MRFEGNIKEREQAIDYIIPCHLRVKIKKRKVNKGNQNSVFARLQDPGETLDSAPDPIKQTRGRWLVLRICPERGAR